MTQTLRVSSIKTRIKTISGILILNLTLRVSSIKTRIKTGFWIFDPNFFLFSESIFH